jgi:hypothetical protein
MSRADLHPAISAEYDALRRGWLVWIPRQHIEDEAHRQGLKFVGPEPSYSELKRSGERMGEDVARALAAPGPVQREVRRKIAANNRRRFGP